MSSPRVFISATSGDLRSARQVVKEALLTINCHPVEQTNFEPDYRTVEQMLREKIRGCQALVHLAGLRYGAEPDPMTLPEGRKRRSYTQMEYDIAKELGLRVYTFVMPPGYPYDVARDGDGQPMPAESEDRQALQRQHREALQRDSHVYELPESEVHLKARILALQEKVIELERQQLVVSEEVKRSRAISLRAFVLIVLLLVAGGAGVVWMMMRQESLIATTKLDAAAVRARLTEASERTRDADLAAAEKTVPFVERERLTEAARQAHAGRLEKIGDLAARLVELTQEGESSPLLGQMVRLTQEEGVEVALGYVNKQRASVLEEVRLSRARESARSRRQLEPLLKAAELAAAKGSYWTARQYYEEVLELEPRWTETLLSFGWFLHDESVRLLLHGSLKQAEETARVALERAVQGVEIASGTERALNLLAASHAQLGEVLQVRAGSAPEEALRHLEEAVAVAEKMRTAFPTSEVALHAVAVNSNKLGDYLFERGDEASLKRARECYERSLAINESLQKAGDDSARLKKALAATLTHLGDVVMRGPVNERAQALAFYERGLELSLARRKQEGTGSRAAARDLTVSLDRMGDYYAAGKDEAVWSKALTYYHRAQTSRESLLKDQPESTQELRDVFVSLQKVAKTRLRMNGPEDRFHALVNYQRSLEICEKLLEGNPDSLQSLRDVADCHYQLGDLLIEEKGLDQALEHLRASVDYREKVLAAEPDSTKSARLLTMSLGRAGMLLVIRAQQPDMMEALALGARELELYEGLLKGNPKADDLAIDLSLALDRRAEVLMLLGTPARFEEAEACYQRSLKLRQELWKRHPDSPEHLTGLVLAWSNLATMESRGGGDPQKYYRACFELLRPLAEKKMPFESQVKRLYDMLEKVYGVQP